MGRVVVLPHHERSYPERVAAELAGTLPADITALGIDGATGCISEGAGWRTGRRGGCAVSRGRVGAVCGGEGFWSVAQGASIGG